MVVRQDEVIILPLETLRIEVGDPAMQRFLLPRILDSIKEKHGIEYSIEESQGLLKEIRLKGSGICNKLDGLKNPLAWTFEKASARCARISSPAKMRK